MVERVAYTVQEVADMLGMSREGVYRLIRDNRIRAIVIGVGGDGKPAPRRLRIPKAALEEFLQGGQYDDQSQTDSRVAN